MTQPSDPGAAFARCFASRDGEIVLAHLRQITLERSLGPQSSDAALRHLEGQRCLMRHILTLTARGHEAATLGEHE